MWWRVWAILALLISVPAWSATYSVSQIEPAGFGRGARVG